jgi:hypothetical protein
MSKFIDQVIHGLTQTPTHPLNGSSIPRPPGTKPLTVISDPDLQRLYELGQQLNHQKEALTRQIKCMEKGLDQRADELLEADSEPVRQLRQAELQKLITHRQAEVIQNLWNVAMISLLYDQDTPPHHMMENWQQVELVDGWQLVYTPETEHAEDELALAE